MLEAFLQLAVDKVNICSATDKTETGTAHWSMSSPTTRERQATGFQHGTGSSSSWKVSSFTLSRWRPKPLIHLFNSAETYLGQWVQLLSCFEPQHIHRALAYNQCLYENYVASALQQQFCWSVPNAWAENAKSMNHKITQSVRSFMLNHKFCSKHTPAPTSENSKVMGLK